MEISEELIVLVGQKVQASAVENMAQLTRFVYREEITAKDAATLAWDIAEAFGTEMARRLAIAQRDFG